MPVEEDREIELPVLDERPFSLQVYEENAGRTVRTFVRSDLAVNPNVSDSVEPIQNREKVSDRVVHIEDEIVPNIPAVPRFCEQMEESERGYVQVDGDCKLYVEQEGAGEPIVLLHGGPGATHHYFHPHFSKLADSARVISYDQRGCGLSNRNEGDGYSIDQAVDDLENLRKALGIDRWTVIGHSYGGLLAQCYAKKYPQSCKGLVLTCASPGVLNLEPGRSNAFLSENESKKIGSIHSNPNLTEPQKVYNAFLNGDWKRQDLYKPTREEMAQFALYEWDNDPDFRNNVSQEAGTYDLEGAFKDCPIPTLIAEGGKDMTWNTDKAGKFHQNHPNAQMVTFDNSAHYPFKDEPETFFNELGDFLKKLPAETPSNLPQWEAHVAQWEEAKRNSPDNLISSLYGDPTYYQKIADAYLPEWLNQLKYSSSFREVGFALYITGVYEEALANFQKMEELGTHPFEIATALIWQGHMLDIIGRRDEAITVYKRVEEMNINNEISLDQFGLTYRPSSYATERIKTSFGLERINVDEHTETRDLPENIKQMIHPLQYISSLYNYKPIPEQSEMINLGIDWNSIDTEDMFGDSPSQFDQIDHTYPGAQKHEKGGNVLYTRIPFIRSKLKAEKDGLELVGQKIDDRVRDEVTFGLGILDTKDGESLASFRFNQLKRDGYDEWDMKHREVRSAYRSQGMASNMMQLFEEFLTKRAKKTKVPQVITADIGQVDVLSLLIKDGFEPASPEDQEKISRLFNNDGSLVVTSGPDIEGKARPQWYIFNKKEHCDEDGNVRSDIWESYSKKPEEFLKKSFRIHLKKEISIISMG